MSEGDAESGARTAQETGGTEQIEEPYTVGECIINVEGDTDRPEVFVETSAKDVGPATRVSLLRNSDALDLYEQLGEYLESEGYDV